MIDLQQSLEMCTIIKTNSGTGRLPNSNIYNVLSFSLTPTDKHLIIGICVKARVWNLVCDYGQGLAEPVNGTHLTGFWVFISMDPSAWATWPSILRKNYFSNIIEMFRAKKRWWFAKTLSGVWSKVLGRLWRRQCQCTDGQPVNNRRADTTFLSQRAPTSFWPIKKKGSRITGSNWLLQSKKEWKSDAQ